MTELLRWLDFDNVQQRILGFISMLSLSCTVLATWERMLILVSYFGIEDDNVACSVPSLFTAGFTK